MLKVFAFSQGKGLEFFHSLVQELSRQTQVSSASHYVSDSNYFNTKACGIKDLAANGKIIKEWEIVTKGVKRKVSEGETALWEKRLGITSLWPAIIADRRFINGLYSKFTQDYAPQYTHEEMQGVLVELLETVWNAFEETKPNLVLSFSASTLGCYIAPWIAKAKGIPCLNLKSTKISNYVSLSSDFVEQHEHIRKEYKALSKEKNIPTDFVKKFISQAQTSEVVYEGSLKKKQSVSILKSLWIFIKTLPVVIKSTMNSNSSIIDPQYYPAFLSNWYSTVRRACRTKKSLNLIYSRTFNSSQLKKINYIFFPLNSEPEIALSVYAPHFMNQIEVARNIAQSLPFGWKLVVKDHPRSWGLRSVNYYKKLLEIPNLNFVSVDHSMRDAVLNSKLVTVISSFVGFEAILMKKPVITLGHTLYEILPKEMIQKLHSTDELPNKISWIIENYKYDEASVENFLSAVTSQSAPLDLYSEFLKKSGREVGALNDSTKTDVQISNFSKYLLKRFEQEKIN